MLGNRGPNKNGEILKWCPICQREGKRKKTNEVHVIMECKGTRQERKRTRINEYIRWANKARITSEPRILRDYLGGDGAKTKVLKQRGMRIQWIITRWLQKTAVI